MITFPNAKINIGLRITERRPDGYHNLETVFAPVGLHAGTPVNPESFCDVLEIVGSREFEFRFGGRSIDCPLEKNLVYRAVKLFEEELQTKRGLLLPPVSVALDKVLPDGAGLGGGSADASFTLKMLNDLYPQLNESFTRTDKPFTEDELEAIALRLGADCPVFIRNRSCYAEGVGEKMKPIDLPLKGMWCVNVKPPVYVSTKEAFAGVTPHKDPDAFPLDRLGELPIEEWKHVAVNDFEASLFPKHPELAEIKSRLYDCGAHYASMSGSGSALYGLFADFDTATSATLRFPSPLQTYLLLL